MKLPLNSPPPLYDYINFDFNIVIENLKEYLEIGIKLVNEKEKQILARKSKFSQLEDDNLNYSDNGEYENIKNRFLLDAFLKSALMYLCSQFEIKIRDICISTYCVYYGESIKGDKMYAEMKKDRPKIYDYAKLLIEKKEIDYDFKAHKDWIAIKDLIFIRNLIVHSDGFVKKIDEQESKIFLTKYQKYFHYNAQFKTIFISNDYFNEFLLQFSETLRLFLKDIIQDLHDRSPKN